VTDGRCSGSGSSFLPPDLKRVFYPVTPPHLTPRVGTLIQEAFRKAVGFRVGQWSALPYPAMISPTGAIGGLGKT
jgi:hypothetical protein